MNIIRINNVNIDVNIPLQESCCCYGSFDGFHLGHMELVNEVLKQNKYKKACLFFSKPFSLLFSKSIHANSLIMTIEDKIEFLEKLGFDYVFIIDISNELITLDYEKFIEKYIVKLNVKKVVVGSDFSFGYKGLGKSSTLLNYPDKFETVVKDILVIDDLKISSTNIRNALLNGDIDLANKMLGRYYSIKGKVIHGLANGFKLGFPTANLTLLSPYIVPKNGVYSTLFEIDDKKYLSMTNIGTHPTISELKEKAIETNIFNYSEEIYDKEVRLDFLDKVRDEKKFDSIEDLKSNLKQLKETISAKYEKLV